MNTVDVRETVTALNGDGVITLDEKVQCAQPWIDTYLAQQDLDGDRRISLAELLAFNGVV